MSQTLIPNQLTAPPTAPTLTPGTGGSLGNGVYLYKISFIVNNGETLPSNYASATIAASGSCTLTNLQLGPSYCLGRAIYRTLVGGTDFKLVALINNIVTSYLDTASDGSITSASAPFISSNNVDPMLNVNGILNIMGFIRAPVSPLSIAFASLSAGGICNGSFNKITITSASIADNATLSTPIQNDYLTSNSILLATVQNNAGVLASISPATTIGTYILNVTNVSGAIITGNLIIAVQIVN